MGDHLQRYEGLSQKIAAVIEGDDRMLGVIQVPCRIILVGPSQSGSVKQFILQWRKLKIPFIQF